MKSKTKPKKRAPTSTQEEVTHLGVIVNMLLSIDPAPRGRIVSYLVDRFVDY